MTKHPAPSSDLAEQLHLLQAENQRLTTLSDDFFLLGNVAEKIATATDPDGAISLALEQIAVCKGIELCLFGSVDEKQISITHSHTTSHPLAATQAMGMAIPVPIAPIPTHNRICSEEEAKELLAIIKNISPKMSEIIRSSICLVRPRFYGTVSIFILADSRPRQELQTMEPLMNRVADIIISRLDSMMMQDSMRTVNRLLEAKVAKRTDELLKLNETLSQEVNERKKVERELRASENLYRTLVDNLPLGITVIDKDNRISMVNRTQANWFGKPAAYYPGTLCHKEFERRDQPCAGCPGATSLKTGGLTISEREGTRSDGSRFPVRLRTVPLPSDDDSPAGFIEVVEDISELKQEEQKRVRFMKKLLHTQKLESLGVLAGGIAHDFNNILMVILGHAELAKMTLPPTTPVRDNLTKIELAAQKAADLSRQMLAYSGRGQFVIETLDIGNLISDMVHMLEVSISKKAVLRFNQAKDLPPVEVDATQIRQVLMNLVINASEAIGDKSGVIAISTGAMVVDRDYLAETWLDENLVEGLYIFIEVADSGCGMDGETIKRVFDPFYTTKFMGRGLGMAAVLGIVRGHNGTIKLYSEPGKGSTFKVILPASPGHTAEMRQQSTQNILIKGSGTILLVDDEETLRALGQEMLKTLGFQVITAEDGRQALEKYRTNGDAIEAVLLDLTMPHMDGEETYRELRRLRPDIRVIMSSGYNEYEVCQRFIGKGLSGFIQKPYKLSELSAVLTEAFRTAEEL